MACQVPQVCQLALGLALLLLAQASASQQQFLKGNASRFGSVEEGPFDPSGPPFSVEANSCGYGPLPLGSWPYEFIAGISSGSPIANQTSMGGCGACLQVKCVNTTASKCKGSGDTNITVQVVDSCATCKNTSLNLHASAFARLAASPEDGQIEVEYQQVPCTPPGNITVHIPALRREDGAYIKLALRNVAGDGNIVAVGMARAGLQDSPLLRGRGGGGAIWRNMDNSHGAVWEYSGLPLTEPGMDLRVTDASGEILDIRNAIPAEATPGDYPTQAQFQVQDK